MEVTLATSFKDHHCTPHLILNCKNIPQERGLEIEIVPMVYLLLKEFEIPDFVRLLLAPHAHSPPRRILYRTLILSLITTSPADHLYAKDSAQINSWIQSTDRVAFFPYSAIAWK